MLSFIEARGGGTSLWSSTFTGPVVILFRHYGKTNEVVSRIFLSYHGITDLVNDMQRLAELLHTA